MIPQNTNNVPADHQAWKESLLREDGGGMFEDAKNGALQDKLFGVKGPEQPAYSVSGGRRSFRSSMKSRRGYRKLMSRKLRRGGKKSKKRRGGRR